MVHACDDNKLPTSHFAESLSNWQRLFPHVPVSYKQVDGPPGRILTAYTSFSDLTVVGRRDDRGGSGHGSTLRALLNHAQATVVIVPSH